MKLFGRGTGDGTVSGEIKELTNQFHVTLRAYFARIQLLDGKLPEDALKRVKELLTPGRERQSWSEAYEIEQMLVDLYDEEALKTESEVRSREGSKALNPSLGEFYVTELKNAKTVEQRRSLLARLVNDLQWRYTVNDVKRQYSQDITSRTGWLFALSLLAFVAWTAYIVITGARVDDMELLIIAAFAGTWGATFSMLASLKNRLGTSELDDMKLMRPWVMLLSRALIGTGAGCVLYFFVRSGLLGGDAFPRLANIDLNAAGLPRKDLALLIIWCFIAGFSEKLVPSILEKTESRNSSAAPTGPERFRPSTNKGGAGNDSSSSAGGGKDQGKGAESK